MVGVFIPLAALLIAVLMVAALWLWWTGDQSEAVAQPEGAAQLDNSIDFAAFTAAPVVTHMPSPMPVAATSTPSANELMRIIRTNDGQLAVQLDGTTYHSVQDINMDAARREHFMSTLRSLSQFAQAAEHVSAPQPITSPKPQPTVTPVSMPAYTPMPTSTSAPSSGMFAAVKSVVGGNGKKGQSETPEIAPRTMADEIEELLQARLMRMADMEDRAIHIFSSPSGGVQIQIDNLMYESVGDITDAAARSVIEAAIRDWEKANPI